MSTREELLTLYNPYSTNFAYKVSCTAPALYTVQPNSGSIPRNSQLQVMVKLKPAATMIGGESSSGSGSGSASSSAPLRVSNRDRFMVELYEEGTRILRGKQVIAVEFNGGSAGATAQAAQAWAPAVAASSHHTASSSSSRSSTKHAPSASAASSHSAAGSSVSAASASHLSNKWSSLALPLRLLPLLVGTVLVGLISSGELVVSRHGFERGGAAAAVAGAAGGGAGKVLSAGAGSAAPCTDDPVKLWLCFCIGLITCATQIKFFEL